VKVWRMGVKLKRKGVVMLGVGVRYRMLNIMRSCSLVAALRPTVAQTHLLHMHVRG